jgi:hypothetical protein
VFSVKSGIKLESNFYNAWLLMRGIKLSVLDFFLTWTRSTKQTLIVEGGCLWYIVLEMQVKHYFLSNCLQKKAWLCLAISIFFIICKVGFPWKVFPFNWKICSNYFHVVDDCDKNNINNCFWYIIIMRVSEFMWKSAYYLYTQFYRSFHVNSTNKIKNSGFWKTLQFWKTFCLSTNCIVLVLVFPVLN